MAEDESLQYNKQPVSASTFLKAKGMDLESGLLGKLFGNKANAPSNIAGLIVVLLVLSGLVITFVEAKIDPKEYWAIISSIITLILGYLFGKGQG
ncbi:MAG: hypothetical protein CMF25_00380 [Kangiellaceae bacterium]|nr:hypothetical protein [Kangiellaceae bacterium]|tara:strand:- start:166 stop:450 length:285 start_codon:yes stop_codon:yes gene_type:complete